jgi:tetratricopeptide (TPR) repeat protein
VNHIPDPIPTPAQPVWPPAPAPAAAAASPSPAPVPPADVPTLLSPPALPVTRFERDRIPIFAAVWNATGLGAGYVYLRAWWYAVGSWPVTGLLVWNATGPAQPATGWRLALGAWLVAMVGHGWWLGRSRVRRQVLQAADRSGDWGQLVAALTVIGVLAAGLGVLRWDAYRIHRSASDHHAGGDCEAALSELDRLDRWHRLPSGSAIAAANRERDACRRLLLARQVAATGEPGRALAILDGYLDLSAAAWAGPARPWRAELLFAHANQLLAAGLTGPNRQILQALQRFEELLAEHPDSPEAGRVEAAIASVTSELVDEVTEGDACAPAELVELLAGLPSGDGLVGRVAAGAAELQPTLYLHCGDQLRAGGERDEAGRWYELLIDSYPDHELVDDARDRLAEIAVQDEIDAIDEQDPGRLELPLETGSAASGQAVVLIGNGSDEALELLYTGPEVDRLRVPAGGGSCEDGTAETVTLRVPAGRYEVALRAADGGVTPLAGSWRLGSGIRYVACYFITD